MSTKYGEVVLVNNYLTGSELKFLLRELIEVKINFHKLRRLSATEGNSLADTTFDDLRIDYLKSKLEDLQYKDIDANSKEIWEVRSDFTFERVKK